MKRSPFIAISRRLRCGVTPTSIAQGNSQLIVRLGTSFEAGPPAVLFQTHLRQPISAQDAFAYDVTGDGQRFLINTKVDEPNAAPLSIILNWASEIDK